jgi:hypothetical protein
MKTMTVKDLIHQLQKLPQDAICITTNSNTMEQSGDELLTKPSFYATGSVKEVWTRDAFDGGKYSYNQYSIVGGKTPIVKF